MELLRAYNLQIFKRLRISYKFDEFLLHIDNSVLWLCMFHSLITSQFPFTGSSSGKIEWKQALSHKNYYKEPVPKASNANPTSLSEFGFETSGKNTQSRYPSTNNSPYSSPGILIILSYRQRSRYNTGSFDASILYRHSRVRVSFLYLHHRI